MPFHRQEKPYSCVNACLRMIFDYSGIEVSEKELRDKCNTTELGTYAESIISCVKQYKCSAKLATLSMVDLKEHIKEDIFPIVYINLYHVHGKYANHAVIVEKIDKNKVLFVDPLRGATEFELSLFCKCWEVAGNLGIIIHRDS
ncbi:MAG: hypothetical protein GY941_23385 [Planctomycetes bacterium]|nr:hypothetical protein [Planctomycetota bacterium]